MSQDLLAIVDIILDPECLSWGELRLVPPWNIISYPLFADAGLGIYLHAASQYHARPKARRGIAMLRGSKQGVTNLSHAQIMCIPRSNVAMAFP